MAAESSAVAWHRRPAIGLAGGRQERVAPHDGERRAMSTQRAAALCFALFVFAGYYKAADLLRFVPFDLTLAFWLTTAGFCLHALWRQRSEERRVGKGCASTGRSRWRPYH